MVLLGCVLDFCYGPRQGKRDSVQAMLDARLG
jgi:hypothetical protein